MYYEARALFVQHAMLNFALANAFTLLQLMKSDNITPAQFLRYLENGGQEVIERVFDNIQAAVKRIRRK